MKITTHPDRINFKYTIEINGDERHFTENALIELRDKLNEIYIDRENTGAIPIRHGKNIGEQYGFDQIIIIGVNPNNNQSSVATWGKTTEQSHQVAIAGNKIKKEVLKWNEENCNAISNKIKKLLKDHTNKINSIILAEIDNIADEINEAEKNDDFTKITILSANLVMLSNILPKIRKL